MIIIVQHLIFMTSLLNLINRFKKNKRGKQDVGPTQCSQEPSLLTGRMLPYHTLLL